MSLKSHKTGQLQRPPRPGSNADPWLPSLESKAPAVGSEVKYRDIFENIQDVYYEVSLDGHIIEVSPSIEEMSGYKREELLGKSLYEFYADPEQRDRFVAELLECKKLTDYEIVLKDKDGSTIHCSVIAKLIRDGTGKAKTIVGSLRSIAERKRIEEALRKSESTLSAILAASPVGIGLVQDRIIKWGNKALYEMLDYTPEDLSDQPIRKIYPDEATYDRVGRDLYPGLARKGIEQIETQWATRDNRLIACHLQASTLDPLNPAKGVLFAAMDISKRKQAEDDLRRSETEKKAILDTTIDSIRHVDKDLKILWYNRKTAEMLQPASEQILGRPCYEVFLGRKAPCRNCPTLKAMQSGQTENAVMHHPGRGNNGGDAYLDIYSAPLTAEPGQIVGFIQVARDITEQKKAMEALQESEEKYRQLFENESDAVLVFDSETKRFEDANQATLDLYGYTKEEFLQLTVLDISNEKEKTRAAVKRIAAGESGSKRVPLRYFRKKDGSVFPGEVSSGSFKSGDRIKIIGAVRDITERLQAEETIHALTQAQMNAQERERLEISRYLHDQVAQDLSTLKITCQTLFDDMREFPDGLKDQVSEMTKLLQDTIATVRDLSYNLRPPGMEHLGLAHTLFQYCEDFSKKTGLRIDFTSAGMDELKTVELTEINLFRLLQEALNNIHQHARAGRATVRLVASFPHIILRIEDNGIGFDVRRCLQKAAREKRMGLGNMQERIRILEGRLRIESRAGEGSKIVAEVPYKEKPGDNSQNRVDHR
jgi:PAS domain S-box-containing protein